MKYKDDYLDDDYLDESGLPEYNGVARQTFLQDFKDDVVSYISGELVCLPESISKKVNKIYGEIVDGLCRSDYTFSVEQAAEEIFEKKFRPFIENYESLDFKFKDILENDPNFLEFLEEVVSDYSLVEESNEFDLFCYFGSRGRYIQALRFLPKKVVEKQGLLKKVKRLELANYYDDKLSERIIKESKNDLIKILLMSKLDKGYVELVKAYGTKSIQEYKLSLLNYPENKKNLEEMVSLGINTEIFLNGIEERFFEFSQDKGTRTIELKDIYLEVRKAFTDLLSEGVLKNPKDFIKYLNKSVYQRDDETINLENLVSMDVSTFTAFINRTLEYISKKDNILNQNITNNSRFHIQSSLSLLKRKPKQEFGNEVYSLRLSNKNPISDLTIGNDSGCCIGIYGDEDYLNEDEDEPVMSNGIYMPFYLKDVATQFIEIYCNQQRIGSALLFACKSDEGPVLAINSIELSKSMKNKSEETITSIVDNTLEYIKDYAQKSGFKHLIMGQHNYNTAVNYGTMFSRNLEPLDIMVRKINHFSEEFYSDILDSNLFVHSKHIRIY